MYRRPPFKMLTRTYSKTCVFLLLEENGSRKKRIKFRRTRGYCQSSPRSRLNINSLPKLLFCRHFSHWLPLFPGNFSPYIKVWVEIRSAVHWPTVGLSYSFHNFYLGGTILFLSLTVVSPWADFNHSVFMQI